MASMSNENAASREVERACRESYGRLVAYLATGSRDLTAAEDALSDAFASALKSWPQQGVPENPEAWLLTAARRKLIDQHRKSASRDAARETLILAAERAQQMTHDEDFFPDERLKLMFVCAHPAIDPAIRTPLMLQTVLGLNAAQIASAFLVAPKTMGQRLSRAKAKIRDAKISFRMPSEEELPERLHSVHEAIYTAFGLAWELAGNSESQVMSLCDEAIWLSRITDDLLPAQAESKGLLALILYCHSRRLARRSATGLYVPLDEQDTERWSGELIDEAETVLSEASQLRNIGPYQLEAAIQSAHAARRFTGKTDWANIVSLYEGLLTWTPSVGAHIGYAVALERAGDPLRALSVFETIDPQLVAIHQPFWAAKAHILQANGRSSEAVAALQTAIGLSEDEAQRQFLQQKLSAIKF